MMKKTFHFHRRLNQVIEIALFLAPAAIGLFLFQYLPFYQAIKDSFYQYNLLDPTNREFIGTENYLRLFSDMRFFQSLLRSFKFVLLTVGLQIPIALVLSLLVRQTNFFNSVIRSSVFLPIVTSVTIVAVIFNLMYDPVNGFINSLLAIFSIPNQPFLTSSKQALPSIAIMTIWQEVGFSMLIFLTGLQSIPVEYYEAASIDGAGKWDSFRFITLPLLKRMILFAVLSATVFSFTIFSSVYVMTRGGPSDSTRLVVYHIWETAFRFLEMGYASALTVITVLIMLVIAYFESRAFRASFEY